MIEIISMVIAFWMGIAFTGWLIITISQFFVKICKGTIYEAPPLQKL